MNGYELSRDWFDYCFENPEHIKPIHTAIYFFAIERCNRMGWKSKFGLPTDMTMEALGIGSYNTYIKAFNKIVEWGFITLIQKSKNQYSSNIIALSKNDKAIDKALDKALTKQTTKQSESTIQSNDSIDKQTNNKQLNKEQTNKGAFDFEKNKSFIKKICEQFSQTGEAREMKVYSFLKNLHNQNKLEEFKIQTDAYFNYKTKSEEKIHSWLGFQSDWESVDWKHKLGQLETSNEKTESNNQYFVEIG